MALAQQRCSSPLETSKLDLPRDPNFAAKAGPILDLYQRVWEGAPLGADDYVICADEKTSIQARRRKQPTLPLAPNRPTYVEHEYFRMGAWTYLAAWDVYRARVFAAVKLKVELLPSIGVWAKSWGKSLRNLLAASFGSWTTALLIEGRRPSTACVTGGPT